MRAFPRKPAQHVGLVLHVRWPKPASTADLIFLDEESSDEADSLYETIEKFGLPTLL